MNKTLQIVDENEIRAKIIRKKEQKINIQTDIKSHNRQTEQTP